MRYPHIIYKIIIQLPFPSGLRVIPLHCIKLIGFVLHNLAFHLSQPLPLCIIRDWGSRRQLIPAGSCYSTRAPHIHQDASCFFVLSLSSKRRMG